MATKNYWQSPHVGRFLLLTIVITAFTVTTMVIVELSGGAAAFRTLVTDTGAWTPVVFVLLKAATYVIAPLSGASIKLASGALFGTWEGLLLSTLGDALGSSLNYWIARIFGRAGIQKFAGKNSLRQVDHVAVKVGTWRMLLGARIILSFMYDFISYAAGLAKIPFRQFALISIGGGIPISLLYTVIGDASVESASVSRILIFVFAGILFAAIAAYALYKYMQRKRGQAPLPEESLGE